MPKIKIEFNNGQDWVVKAELEQHSSLTTKEQIASYIALYSEIYAHRAYVDDTLVATCQPKSLPEVVEDEFTYQGSLVPTIPRPIRAFLVYGLDVPIKMVFVSPSMNEALLPYIINNKKPDGPYQYVDEVVGGFFRMQENPYQTGDQTNIDGNETIRQGTKPLGEEEETDVAYTELLSRDEKPHHSSAWQIKTEKETFILVIPESPDSFEVADTIADQIVGRFVVNAFKGGQLTIGKPVPGWNLLILEKEDENISMVH